MLQPGIDLLGLPVPASASSPAHPALMAGMSGTTRSARVDSATMQAAVPFELNASGDGRKMELI
jgi:hypothetical protein